MTTSLPLHTVAACYINLCEDIGLLVRIFTEFANGNVISHTDDLVSQFSQLLLTKHLKFLVQYQRLQHNECMQRIKIIIMLTTTTTTTTTTTVITMMIIMKMNVTYITEAANVLQITELLYKSQQIILYLLHSMQLA